MTRSHALAIALAAASAWALGCSALTRAPSEEVACVLREDGSDPCLELSRVCVSGFCRSREVCNGVDDDLDGYVDEGPESDADLDGFTWCGGGIAALADCDDEDADVHPADPARGIAAPDEICDGRDNQCDGSEVDLIEASNCAAPQQCSRSAGRCVDPLCTFPEFRCADGFQCVDGACRPGDCSITGCAAPEVCDPVTSACVAPRPIGALCDNDAECIDQICMPAREALGLEVGLVAGTRGVCTRACCDSRDCPAGQACWAAGTGARGCVDRALLARGTYGAPDETDERTCTDRVACEPSQCLPTRFEAYDRERSGFVCGATTRVDQASCESDDQCESGVCLLLYEFWSPSRWRYVTAGTCISACRTGADCLGYQQSWNGSRDGRESGDIQLGCLNRRFDGTIDWTQVCWAATGAPTGAACTTNADCLEDACIAGTCRPTCCSNADCNGELCRPFVQGDHWEMRCFPALQLF